MNQHKFYKFRNECTKGVRINDKYTVSIEELMEIISDIVIDIIEIDEHKWELLLSDIVVDDNNIIYIEKI